MDTAEQSHPNTLKVNDIHFQFNDKSVIEKVSFDFQSRDMVALLGVNGGGKTTLLRCLTGYYKIQGGSIFWNGSDIRTISNSNLAKIVTLVDSEWESFFNLPVREILLLGRSPHVDFFGNFTKNDLIRVDEIAELLGLKRYLDTNFQNLSKGEMQRVRLGMALVSDPKFLLLDEPTSHLDPYYQREILTLLKRISIDRGTGILAVLHDVNQARLFDNVLILHQGKILRYGPTNKILDQACFDEVYGKGVFHAFTWENSPIGLLQPKSTENPASSSNDC